MDHITIIGIAASVLTGVSMLPQLFKMLKEKKAEVISVLTLAVLCCGLLLWVCYGFFKDDWIIIISNGFSLLVNLIIIILSLKYKKRNDHGSKT